MELLDCFRSLLQPVSHQSLWASLLPRVEVPEGARRTDDPEQLEADWWQSRQMENTANVPEPPHLIRHLCPFLPDVSTELGALQPGGLQSSLTRFRFQI